MESRKISVSLSEPDVAFIDRYTAEHEVPSRSATVQRAIALLRANELSDAYVEAWQEWSEQDGAGWEPTVADGLDHRDDAAR
jgi:Arc/MetJ-type ribon-helix-helix transcriptional regulator